MSKESTNSVADAGPFEGSQVAAVVNREGEEGAAITATAAGAAVATNNTAQVPQAGWQAGLTNETPNKEAEMKTDNDKFIISNCAADAAEGAVPADCRWETQPNGPVKAMPKCLHLVMAEKSDEASLLRQLSAETGSDDGLLRSMREKSSLAAGLLRRMRVAGSPAAECLILMLDDDRTKRNGKLTGLRLRLGLDHPVSSVIVQFQYENPAVEAWLRKQIRAQDRFIKPGDREVVQKFTVCGKPYYFTSLVCEGDVDRLADNKNRVRYVSVYTQPCVQKPGSEEWETRQYLAFDEQRLRARVCATELWLMRNRPGVLYKVTRSRCVKPVERQLFLVAAEAAALASSGAHAPKSARRLKQAKA